MLKCQGQPTGNEIIIFFKTKSNKATDKTIDKEVSLGFKSQVLCRIVDLIKTEFELMVGL